MFPRHSPVGKSVPHLGTRIDTYVAAPNRYLQSQEIQPSGLHSDPTALWSRGYLTNMLWLQAHPSLTSRQLAINLGPARGT